MSITVNNGVSNIKATPGIIADDYANIPAATDVATGTIFIDTVGLMIYRSEAGGWFVLGGGSIPNLQQVLDAGNTAANQSITLSDSSGDISYFYPYNIICEKTGNSITEHYSSGIDTTDLATNIKTSYRPNFINFQNLVSLDIQQLYPNPTFSNQKSYLPEDNGTLALQNPPFISTISSTPFTPTGTKNGIYRVATGASSIVLNPANWVDRKTLTFCFDITAVTFSITGGATLRGLPIINVAGLYYVTYLSSFNTFYLSHTA